MPGLAVGISVGDGVRVTVGDGVMDGTSVFVGVALGPGVGVRVGVLTGVGVEGGVTTVTYCAETYPARPPQITGCQPFTAGPFRGTVAPSASTTITP